MEKKHHFRAVFKSDHLSSGDLEDLIEQKRLSGVEKVNSLSLSDEAKKLYFELIAQSLNREM